MRLGACIIVFALVAGCVGSTPRSEAPLEPAAPAFEPFVGAVTKFTDCYGWMFNQIMPYDKALAIVPVDFTPERAGPSGGIVPPPSDPQAGRKILWSLRCSTGTVGTETFTQVGYLYACVPSVPRDVEWQNGYKRDYLAVELAVFPPAMARKINEATGLHVTPAELTVGAVDVRHNGVHDWRVTTDNWTFTLDRRVGEPIPAVYRYETRGVTALWTTFDNVSARAHRSSHGGYGNLNYEATPKFEGNTPATQMFAPGERVSITNLVGFTGELGGATDTWTPEAQFLGNGTRAPR